MELPIPTGEKLIISEAENTSNSISFLRKYANILSYIQKYDDELNEIPNEIEVSLNINNIDDLDILKVFLSDVNRLYKPTKEYYNQFIKNLNSDLIQNSEQIDALFKGIQDVVDKHNLYFQKLSRMNISKAINNHTTYSMFKVINNPVNLIQAQTSVDGTTDPLKNIADNSPKGLIVKQRTPGNAINKFYSIVENQVGKQGIGICAVGLKSFFALTQYNNYILTYGTAEQQEKLLLGSHHKGHIINGKTYRTVANIRSNKINNISNEFILQALATVNNDEDSALVLSALLSLATDFRSLIKILQKLF